MLLLIGLWAFSCDGLEVLMETGEIVETAFVTELFDADPVVQQQLAGVSNAYFREKLGIGFAGAGLEIAAEGVGYQSCDGGHLVQIDGACEMAKGIVIDGIDAIIFQPGEIVTKTDRG